MLVLGWVTALLKFKMMDMNPPRDGYVSTQRQIYIHPKMDYNPDSTGYKSISRIYSIKSLY